MATVYKSKIDVWLAAVLAFAIAASLYAAVAVLTTGSASTWWVAVLTIGAGIGLPIWLLLSTNYTLESRELIVRSGPFRWRIASAEITDVTATSNPLSSPALSLDRLRIDYGRGNSIMISPRDKERFLADLTAMRRGAV